MALKPLQQWFCDRCHRTIEKPDDGIVHWRRDGDGRLHAFEILHHLKASPRKGEMGCYPPDMELDMHLDHMIGSRGLVDWLSMVDVGPFHDREGRHVGRADLRAWTTAVRRLFVPYYEEARHYIDRARANGDLDGVNEVALYLEDTLRSLVDRYGED